MSDRHAMPRKGRFSLGEHGPGRYGVDELDPAGELLSTGHSSRQWRVIIHRHDGTIAPALPRKDNGLAPPVKGQGGSVGPGRARWPEASPGAGRAGRPGHRSGGLRSAAKTTAAKRASKIASSQNELTGSEPRSILLPSQRAVRPCPIGRLRTRVSRSGFCYPELPR